MATGLTTYSHLKGTGRRQSGRSGRVAERQAGRAAETVSGDRSRPRPGLMIGIGSSSRTKRRIMGCYPADGGCPRCCEKKCLNPV
ncbi:hypothetical protein M8494_10970 [Serratia ureilytica]